MDKSYQRRIELLMLVIAIVGGLLIVLHQIAIDNHIGPYIITAAEFLIGALVLAIYLRRRLFTLNKKMTLLAIVTSVVFFMAFYLYVVGLMYTTASKNAFLYQTSVVFVPFLNYFIFKQKIGIRIIIGTIIALIGLAFLTLDGSGLGRLNIGDIITIIGALMVATHMTSSAYAMKKQPEADPVTFLTYQMFVAGVLSLVLAIVDGEFTAGVRVEAVWTLILAGIIVGVMFYGISMCLKHSTPTRLSIILATTPIASCIALVVFLNEIMTLKIIIGGGLIMIALLVISIEPGNKQQQIENMIKDELLFESDRLHR